MMTLSTSKTQIIATVSMEVLAVSSQQRILDTILAVKMMDSLMKTVIAPPFWLRMRLLRNLLAGSFNQLYHHYTSAEVAPLMNTAPTCDPAAHQVVGLQADLRAFMAMFLEFDFLQIGLWKLWTSMSPCFLKKREMRVGRIQAKIHWLPPID